MKAAFAFLLFVLVAKAEAKHPNTTAQARHLGAVLNEAEIPTKVFGARETTHNKLNADLGLPDDPSTKELDKFLDPLLGS